jgi:anti-sigma factor RsiW
MPEHLSDGLLIGFLEGTTLSEENRRIVRHLLTQCPVCAARCADILREMRLYRRGRQGRKRRRMDV